MKHKSQQDYPALVSFIQEREVTQQQMVNNPNKMSTKQPSFSFSLSWSSFVKTTSRSWAESQGYESRRDQWEHCAMGFSRSSFRSTVPQGPLLWINYLLDQLGGSLTLKIAKFSSEMFSVPLRKTVLACRCREQIELVIWTMGPIYPVLKHKYFKDKTPPMVFELSSEILLEIAESSHGDEGNRKKRRGPWIGNWEGTEINKFLMAVPYINLKFSL